MNSRMALLFACPFRSGVEDLLSMVMLICLATSLLSDSSCSALVVSSAIPILLITGMGGALGSIIQTIPIKDFALHLTDFKTLGILIPFGIAALLKTAQGSSTVAIITTSSICFPLLPLLELESDMGKVWTIMSLGVGSMTISHANDSYFWIVSQMGGLDVKTAYKTHTMGTLLQGVIGIGVVFSCYSLWTFLN